jgi:integrase
MASPRYVTDKELQSFRDCVPPILACAMDLGLLSGQDLSALLLLTWKDVKTVGVPREKWVLTLRRLRSDEPREVSITPSLEKVLKVCRVLPPNWPHQFVLRLDDGRGMSVKEFNVIWKLYMRRWVESGKERTPFAFRDIRIKVLTDQHDARRVSRRRTPRSGSSA